ncbi:porin [Yoonia sp. 2307UL14-13]|uniref:porin n=1 Tax=Yoonia sp. 2307UL14-13 TaxID=3126506 RepID=UPI0030A38ADF
MKSILLTSTALVAFAGMAAADGHASISFSMETTLGYNDTDGNDGRLSGDDDDPATPDVDESLADFDNELGFYWEGNLKTTASAELDNGLTAGAYFEITIAEDDDAIDNDGGLALSSSDFVLSLEASNGGLFFGDTGVAGDKYWKSAGDMEADGVTTATDSAVIRGDVDAGAYKASVSYIVNDAFDDDGADPNDSLEQLAFGAEADFGVVTLTAAYQEETDFVDGSGDFNADEIYGVSGEGTFGGATVTLAYAENSTDDQQSTGIKVAYPFGPVTATAYYVDEQGGDLDGEANLGLNVAYADGPFAVEADYQDDQGSEKWSLEGSYDVGNGLTLFAGVLNENEEDEDFFAAATYDLGGGAELLVSYAEDDDGSQEDEIGGDEYQEGTTVELTFSF